jgi:hypothetical protein
MRVSAVRARVQADARSALTYLSLETSCTHCLPFHNQAAGRVADGRAPEVDDRVQPTRNRAYVYSVPSLTKHSSLPHGSVT